ncbi:MAG: PKD domain-containing protein, partial [bacterium]
DFTRYEITVENLKLAPPDTYKCLVLVRDTEDLTAPDWLDLTAYRIVTLEVIDHTALFKDPVAIADATPNPQTVCENIEFDATGSNDPDGGSIVLYEWDWNNDGTYDETGDIVNHSFDTIGIHQIQLRVTDDEGGTDELDVPLEVTVENALPTSVIGITSDYVFLNEEIDFIGSFSSDNDCGGDSIVQWGWDWDDDGIVDENAETTSHSWPDAGQHPVQLQVTDDEGGQAWTGGAPYITVVNGWARTWGGSSDDFSRCVVNDSIGNVLIFGTFFGTVDFDPSSAVQTAVSNGGQDCFLSKFDPGGNFLWVKTWGGLFSDNAFDMDINTSDEIFLTGGFSAEVDFDPGLGEDLHTSLGGLDAFLCKFDSNGTFLLAKTWGGTGWDEGRGVIYDEIYFKTYVTGYFDNTVDFDPGIPVQNRISNGWHDVFVSIFNSDGSFATVLSWGGGAEDEAYDIATDNIGSSFIVGKFGDTVDFDPEPDTYYCTSHGSSDIFLNCFRYDAIRLWTHTTGATGSDFATGVSVSEPWDELFIIGVFEQTVNFDDPSSDPHTSNGNSDVFLTRRSTNGVYWWTQTWGGTDTDNCNGLTIDEYGNNVLVTGSFRDTVDFDPGTGITEITSNGESDIYLTKFIVNGSLLWARAWGGSSNDFGYGVSLDDSDNIFTVGSFIDQVNFYIGSGGGLKNYSSTGMN